MPRRLFQLGATVRARPAIPRDCFRVLGAVAFVVSALLLPRPAAPAEGEVPTDVQVALFRKIFSFVKTFETPSKVVVLIVFNEEGRSQVKRLVDAFVSAGIDSRSVKMTALGESVQGLSVLYVLPSAATPEVKALSEQRGLLSISGSPDLVQHGDVAVGVGIEDGSPRIFVNMDRLKRQGHRLSADLLKVAKLTN